MADNLDSPSLGTFGIEDTIEMGMGNQEILKDLFSAESSTGDPDEIKPIEEKPEPVKGKKEEKEEKKEEEEKPAVNTIHDFLYKEDSKVEEKEEEVKTDVKTEPEQQEEVTEFGALAKDLFRLGVFTADEEEEEPSISTPEEFLERFNSEKKKGAIEIVNNFINQFGEDYQQAFNAIFVKGVNPKEYFGTYNNIVDFADLDMTKEENQVAVIRKALTDQGFEPEDITTEVDRLKNYGDLDSVAAKHHKVLVKREAARLQQLEADAEKEMQMRAAIKNQYAQNVQTILQDKLKTKEFDGIPINLQLANELQDFLLVDRYKTPSGELLTEFDKTILELKRPENHSMKVKVALLLKILEKDPTLSTIQRAGVTKKTDQLFGEVARVKTKTTNSGATGSAKDNRWFL